MLLGFKIQLEFNRALYSMRTVNAGDSSPFEWGVEYRLQLLSLAHLSYSRSFFTRLSLDHGWPGASSSINVTTAHGPKERCDLPRF